MPGLDALMLETDGQGSTLVTYGVRQREAVSEKRTARERPAASPFASRFTLLAFRCLSHGSTRQLAGSDESITDQYHFSAFGNAIASSGSTTNAFLYGAAHNYYKDAETALQLLGVRYYDSGVGRFTTLDPAFHALNWYAYAHASPLRHVDPTGTQTGAEVVPITLCIPGLGEVVLLVLVIAAVVAAIIAIVDVVVENAPKVLCKVRHPGWGRCAGLPGDPGTAALTQVPTDPQKPDIVDRTKWFPLRLMSCRPPKPATGCAGGAPGTFQVCLVEFMNRETRETDHRAYSIRCCACCYTIRVGFECKNLHPSGPSQPPLN